MNFTGDCDCCAAHDEKTPSPKFNRPGLPALAYRVGVHGSFRDSLLARLSNTDFPALGALATRRDDDFTIALLDAFATLADVLTFYQERIANESYLRTATLRRSVLELAALIGYRLAPGVAAGTALAFSLETAPGAPALAAQPTTIPAGTRVQSVPQGAQSPQSFETSAAITGRPEWNAIPAQQAEPVIILAGATKEIYVSGNMTQLQPGDTILVVGEERVADTASPQWDARTLDVVEADNAHNVTRLAWTDPLAGPWPDPPPPKGIRVHALRQRASLFGSNAPDARLLKRPDAADVFNLLFGPDGEWANFEVSASEQKIDLDNLYPKLLRNSWLLLTSGAPPDTVTTELYRASSVSHRSRADFAVSAKISTVHLDKPIGSDAFQRRETHVLAQSEELTLVERPLLFPLYGNQLGLDVLAVDLVPGQLLAVSGKRQRVRVGTSTEGVVFLEQPTRQAKARESFVMKAPPTADGVLLDARQLDPVHPPESTLIWTLVDHDGSTITVAAPPGTLSLEPARKGDKVMGEVVTISALDGSVASDQERTTLTLDAGLVNCYDRSTVTVNANVVLATHGETTKEVVGSGNARQSGQAFRLKQSPLTYVSTSEDPSGRGSTLELRVNDLTWTEKASLYGAGPLDRVYEIRQEDDGTTTVAFGDGTAGARLPTGQDNVRATYRKGLGVAGNLRAGQLTTLLTRPLGVKSVTNPAPPRGGEDPETLGNSRRNAPLCVLTLDRAVSIDDYADFSRAFAGIAKAHVTWVSTVPRGVYVTVAGIAGAALPAGSDTLKNLTGALRQFGDPLLPLTVASYVAAKFHITAAIKVAADAKARVVSAAVESALRTAFAFDARDLGQPVTIDEVYAAIHSVPDIVAADVSQFYRTDEGPGDAPPRALAAKLPAVQDDATVTPAELLTLDSAPLKLGTMP